MKEEWKDIKGFENKYRVSNKGRLMSKTFQSGYKWIFKNSTLGRDGYYYAKELTL